MEGEIGKFKNFKIYQMLFWSEQEVKLSVQISALLAAIIQKLLNTWNIIRLLTSLQMQSILFKLQLL